jgi:GT2 family glycosyltransferase
MNVHAVIVGWNGDEWLPDCLSSLARASTDQLHVILVDNHDNPCIPDLDLSAFRTSILKTPAPLGFAMANNYALVHADWEDDGLILFLNQDTRSASGWIDRCIACFQQSPDLAALSPGIRSLDDREWDAAYQGCMAKAVDVPGHNWVEVDEVTAAAMFVRASVLREVGPFDPIFESYYEDYDLCRRIRQRGFRIGVCPEARLFHFNGSITRDTRSERRRMYWVARNRIIARVREAGPARFQALLRSFCWTFPRNLLRGLLGRPSAQPAGVTLKVFRDLLRLAPRLASEKADERAWRKYIEEIDWS